MATPKFLTLTKDVWQIAALPAPFSSLPSRSTDPTEFQTPLSIANAPATTSVQMNAYVVQMLLLLAKADNSPTVGLIRVGSKADMIWYAAEHYQNLKSKSIIASACYNMSSKELDLRGSIAQNGQCSTLQGIPGRRTELAPFNLLAFYVVLTAVARKLNMEFDDMVDKALNVVEKNIGKSAITKEDAGVLFRMSHMFQSFLFYDAPPANSSGLKIIMPGGYIPALTTEAIRGNLYSEAPCVFGKCPTLQPRSGAPGRMARTFGEAKAEFSGWAARKAWTPEEEELIPSFPDDYPIAQDTLKIARRFVHTHNAKRPMVNFLWRGVTSIGKSTGVEMIAALLHTPLVRVTCHSTMETRDFLSEFVPDNGDAYTGPIPGVEEMYIDPEQTYKKITGSELPDATADDCLKELLNRMSRNTGAARFKHVESPYVKALENGWICEIQEISRIKDPGVLVGLNEYDRPNAVIPLVDGSFAHRHPDALCVYTDNVGYVSCRPVDPSVLRRMAFVIDSYELPKSMVLDRIRYNTGFADESKLNLMYRVWLGISKYCQEHDITEGSCSVTELEMWVQAVLADGGDNLYSNCVDCVVAKATSVLSEQKEIKAACLDLALNNV